MDSNEIKKISDLNDLKKVVNDRPIFLNKNWDGNKQGLALNMAITLKLPIAMLSKDITKTWKNNIEALGLKWECIEKINNSVFSPDNITQDEFDYWEKLAS